MQILSKAVSNYTIGGQRAVEFDAQLEALGRWHQKLVVSGFRTEFWDVFRRVLCEIFTDIIDGRFTAIAKPLELEGTERNCAIDAWQKFAHHIVARMKFGFLNGK